MTALLLITLILGSSLVRSLTIDVNSFTYMESAPKTAEPDVYMEVPLLTRGGSPGSLVGHTVDQQASVLEWRCVVKSFVVCGMEALKLTSLLVRPRRRPNAIAI